MTTDTVENAASAMTADVAKVSTAIAEFSRVEAGLAMLTTTFKGVIYEVDSPRGLASAKQARASLREPRYKVESIRKEAKAPLIALGKKLDAEAQRITLAILALEEPIDVQIKGEEDRREKARQAEAEAEQARIASIQTRIGQFTLVIAECSQKPSGEIAQRMASVGEMVIDDSYQEFRSQAEAARADAVVRLTQMRDAALFHEEQQRRAASEREELEWLRKEVAEREAAEKARQADAQRQQEAAQAEAQKKLAAERVAFEQEQAAARAAQKAEADRLAAQREQLEREQAAMRPVEPVPAAAPRIELPPVVLSEEAPGVLDPVRPHPTFDEMAQVIADHYGVEFTQAIIWMRQAI